MNSEVSNISAPSSSQRYRGRTMVLLCALTMIMCLNPLLSAKPDGTAKSFDVLSLQKSSSRIVSADKIDPEEYYVFNNSCLEARGQYEWTIRVRRKQRDFNARRRMVRYRVFYGGGDFVFHKFHVVEDKRLNATAAGFPKRKGTYMLLKNTHANNYHIINDFLLPAYRASVTAGITGLIIPAGCVECWNNRLPLQTLGLDMLNLTVVYPLESAVLKDTRMCFDRLVVGRFNGEPYYSRVGRFSKLWTRDLFVGFRDRAHDYFRKLLQSKELEHGVLGNNATRNQVTMPEQNEATGNFSGVAKTNRNDSIKPVLSWMSRSAKDACTRRCITNEHDAVAQLSKYFDVNLLNFDEGLTTEQAMGHIMNTDVLIGLHGAGLAYSAFLPDRAMLVELRSDYSNRMFINMASSVNIPYYAASLGGCIGPGDNDVFTLPSKTVLEMTEEIYTAYIHEKQLFAQGQPTSNGECDFPQPIEPCGHVSSPDQARCYLHWKWCQRAWLGNWWQRAWLGNWWQCAWHEYC